MPQPHGSFPPNGPGYDAFGFLSDQDPDQQQQNPPQNHSYTQCPDTQSHSAPASYITSHPPPFLTGSPGTEFHSRHDSIASSGPAGYVPGPADPAMAGAPAQASPYPPMHHSMAPGYTTSYSTAPNQYGYGVPYGHPTVGPLPMYEQQPGMYFAGPYPADNAADPLAQLPVGRGVSVHNTKPKAQCWEHGCNGRLFSTFSNLLRHQREKSGTATKSYCPRCGAEFTRTTARNGHLAHDKCKPRKTSNPL